MDDFHPNWIALATVDFEKRLFVKESTEEEWKEKEKASLPVRNLKGEDAKDFYLDVVAGPSSTVPESSNRVDVPRETIVPREVQKINLKKADPRTARKFLTAAQENDCDTLVSVLDEYSDVLNVVDDFGWTPLMCAVQAKAFQAADFLIGKGADVNVRDRTGKCVFSLAEKNGFPISLLCEMPTIDKPPRSDIPARSKRRKYYCDICKRQVRPGDAKTHPTSTLHAFNCSARIKQVTRYGIPEHNRGYQILLRTGWDRENGLGRLGEGRKFPISVTQKLDKDGIGFQRNIVARIDNSKKYHANKRELCKAIDIDKFKERTLRRELS